MRYVLGIDIGTSGAKAILLSGDGKIVSKKETSYSPDFSADGFVDQHPDVWWDAVKRLIKEITEEATAAKESIVSIACSGQMHSSVFLDKDNRVIRPAILWNDTRTTGQIKKIYEKTGGEDFFLTNVCNRVFAGFTLPKILWLKENEPDNYKRLEKVIMPKDYINFMLTGNIFTDFSDAAGTAYFDVKAANWSKAVADALGIDASVFPEAVESTHVVGTVREVVAAELSLDSDTVVLAGGADNSCAAIGNGVVSAGEAVISIGTSGTVVAFLDNIDGDVTGDIHLFNYSYPESYYAMGCMLSAGESFNWLKKNIFPEYSLDELNGLAGKIPAGSNGNIFLPYLFGERSPYNDPNARGVFIGMSGTTGAGELARAVMEGVAFNIKATFDMVTGFTAINDIYITGGGAKSKLWGQIISDVLNREITVLNTPEGPAFGAALIGAVGAGVFESFKSAKEKSVQVLRTITPDNSNIETYKKYYDIFVKAYKNNKEIFADIQDIKRN